MYKVPVEKLILVCLYIYVFIEFATGARVYAIQKVAYGIISFLIITFIAIKQSRINPLGLFFIFLIPTFFVLPDLASKSIPSYIFSDYIVLLFNVSLAAYLIYSKRELVTDNVFYVLIILMFFGTVINMVFGFSVRNTAPYALLIVYSWSLVLHEDFKPANAVAIVVVGILIVISSYRTNIIIYIITPLLLSFFFIQYKSFLFKSVVIGLITLSVVFFKLDDIQNYALEKSRFSTLQSEETDASLYTRVLEIYDVQQYISKNWHVGNYIYGSGLGAVYDVKYSTTHERNITNGKLHNIHFGPALLFFRFGFIGVAFFVCFLFLLAKALFQSFSQNHSKRFYIFTVASLFLVIDFFLRNSFVDPLNTITLAGFLAYRNE